MHPSPSIDLLLQFLQGVLASRTLNNTNIEALRIPRATKIEVGLVLSRDSKMYTLAAFMAFVAAALATTGPCSISEPDYVCEPVMDASACYNAIILGWDGASTNPADIFKCVDPPELVSLFFPLSLISGLRSSSKVFSGGQPGRVHASRDAGETSCCRRVSVRMSGMKNYYV